MKELYTAIQDLFKQKETVKVFNGKKLRVPEFIDLYNGQPEEPNEFEFTLPALFIDYSIAWDRAGTMRKGELTVEVHVLAEPGEETDNLNVPLSGLDKVDYYETISDLLEDLSTSETSKLVLKGEKPVATDYFNYHLLTFSCTISRRRTSVRKEVVENVSIEKKYIID